jgi:hypothetical protein
MIVVRKEPKRIKQHIGKIFTLMDSNLTHFMNYLPYEENNKMILRELCV